MDINVDLEWLQRFEDGFNPRHPEQSTIPASVIGYGEISAVLDVGDGLAYKRMPMFRNRDEVVFYEALYNDSLDYYAEKVGITAVNATIHSLKNNTHGRHVVYIIQKKLPANSLAHNALHLLLSQEQELLFTAVLNEIKKVFVFNATNQAGDAMGFDAQMSNWAIANPDSSEFNLIYIDTSSPLITVDSVEQFNPEFFLRSAPALLVPILRKLFLKDIMTRYYDVRQVCIDLLANLYKEQLPDLVPSFTNLANDIFPASGTTVTMTPILIKEVESYYKEDALIWRTYLGSRKLDRLLHSLFGRTYHYVLPDKIKR